VGHSFGWSVGAFFADPEETKRAPTLCLVGDAGFGLGGMDIETALRYDVPVVYVVTNNNGWMSSIQYFIYGKDWRAQGPQDHPYGEAFLPGLRYYKISEVFPGIHTEHVQEPSEIRPALERAFRAAEKKGYHGKGGPAVVQVDMDLTLITPGVRGDTPGSGLLQAHIPYRDLPPYGQRCRRYGAQMMEEQSGITLFDFDKWGIPPVDPNEPGYEIDPWRPLRIDEECI
jgi:acetolactate synthase-1/2/3 large subunit